MPARERAKAAALSAPAEVPPAEVMPAEAKPAEVPPAEVAAPAEPSGRRVASREARRGRGSRPPRTAALGKRRRLPWPHSLVPWYMAPCSSLACLEWARYRRAQRKRHSKHAARACTAARRALDAVAAG